MTPEQQKALALASARKRQIEASQGISAPQQETPLADQAANLALSYAQGRTLGLGVKPMSAIGATMAYPVVAGAYKLAGKESPSWSDLYQIPVSDIQGRIEQSRKDNPMLSFGAEIAGNLKTGANLGNSKTGQGFSSRLKDFVTPTGSTAAEKAASLGKKAIIGGLVGEAAQRAYDVGTSPTGQESAILFSPSPGVGGMLGAATPLLSAGVSSATKAIKQTAIPALEGPAKEAAQSLNTIAKKHGIDLSVSDVTTNSKYKRAIQQGKMFPFSGAENAAEKTQTQINRAVTRTLGEEADKVTPEYLNKVRQTLGDQFQNFTKGKEFQVTADAYSKIDDITNIASRKGYGAEGEALVKQYSDELQSLVDDRGLIKGDKLDKFRRDLSAVARKQAQSDIGQVASDFEDAVVDIISDSDPAVSKAITDAKYKYKNYKVLLNPAARNQATGDISPASLTGAVQRVYGVDKFATGRAGDLGEIARVGQSLRLPSSSGTAENIYAQRGLLEDLVRTPQYVGNAMLQSYNRNPANVEALLNKGTNLPAMPESVLRKPIAAGMLGGILGSQ